MKIGLSPILFPEKKTRSISSILLLRLNQFCCLIRNSLTDLLSLNCCNPVAIVDVLIVLPGHKLSRKKDVSCPTCSRLLNLDRENFSIYYLHDPLSPYCDDSKINKCSYFFLAYCMLSLNFVKAYFSYWRFILLRLKPKLVIGLMPNPTLCKAASSLSIRVADMQHGVIQYDHDWYKTIIRHDSDILGGSCPTDFFVWNSYSKNVLLSNNSNKSLKDSSVHVVGYNALPDKKLDDNAFNSTSHSHLNILVSCSYDFERIYSTEELSLIDRHKLTTNDFLNFIKNTHYYNIRFRLHPSSRSKSLRNLQMTGISELINSGCSSNFSVSRNSLAQELAWLDLHVTLHSSVALELIPFKKPTCFLCPAQNRYAYQAFRDQDMLYFSSSFNSDSECINYAIDNLHSNYLEDSSTVCESSYKIPSLQSVISKILNNPLSCSD
jgi:hypothetical protein